MVVYKVDRLTRSLLDFAKIVEIFDERSVSFVSVTQQFNTTTVMGRLTLNVLLSFAQFEREVTGERIRDKIAASKKKGMWMGGNAPLGYDVEDRKLVINEAEAETVRIIFRRYTELGSVRAAQGATRPARHRQQARPHPDGRLTGGKPIARVRSITCCRTASIAARSSTRERFILGSMIRSSTRICGRPCRTVLQATGSIARRARVRSIRAC